MQVLLGILLILGVVLGFSSSELCDNGTGECKELSECPAIFYNLASIAPYVKYCDEFNDIVCCPLPLNMQSQAQPFSASDRLRRFERGQLREK